MADNRFKGLPYPITKHPKGYFRTQTGTDQIKSDLLLLLLTNPGERVMLPSFGTPLKDLVFEPNDDIVARQARQMIINAVQLWEPRISIEQLEVSTDVKNILDPTDPGDDIPHILSIKIKFVDFNNINSVQELVLAIPLG